MISVYGIFLYLKKVYSLNYLIWKFKEDLRVVNLLTTPPLQLIYCLFQKNLCKLHSNSIYIKPHDIEIDMLIKEINLKTDMRKRYELNRR